MIDDGDKKVSAWEYVNPINTVKFAYGSPFGNLLFGTYRGMAAGRGLMFPGILAPMKWIGGRALRWNDMLASAGNLAIPGSVQAVAAMGKSIGKGAARGFLFGAEGIVAGSEDAALEAMILARRGKKSLRAWRILKARTVPLGTGGEGVMLRSVAEATAAVGERVGGATIARAGLIWAGRVIDPIMDVLMVGQMVAFAGETAFKGIKATAELLNRTAERVHHLNLGGELSRGFLTGQAVTERQRALQAIQASHLSGRRMMGNEASMVHS